CDAAFKLGASNRDIGVVALLLNEGLLDQLVPVKNVRAVGDALALFRQRLRVEQVIQNQSMRDLRGVEPMLLADVDAIDAVIRRRDDSGEARQQGHRQHDLKQRHAMTSRVCHSSHTEMSSAVLGWPSGPRLKRSNGR